MTPEDPIGGWFNDIEGHWAARWIEKLAEEGIVAGDPDGGYDPNDPVTRAQMAVMIYNAMMWNKETSKGLAYVHQSEFPDDVGILNCIWYYGWGPTGNLSDDKYVPMYRGGADNPWLTLPEDYDGYILLFNEPNNPEPYGADLDPVDAALKYQEALAYHPNAKFIVGGVSAFCDVVGFYGYDWVVPFLAELDSLEVEHPDTWHIHGYAEAWITSDDLIEWWRKHRQLTGADYWVTECGAPNGSMEDFVKMIEFFKCTGWIKRYAAFTNRLSGDEPWCVPGWELTVPLVHWDGGLTEMGEYYIG